MRYYPTFRWTIPHKEVDAYVLLSRSQLSLRQAGDPVLLACLKHAASVYPGPGSNPQKSGFNFQALTNLSSKNPGTNSNRCQTVKEPNLGLKKTGS